MINISIGHPVSFSTSHLHLINPLSPSAEILRTSWSSPHDCRPTSLILRYRNMASHSYTRRHLRPWKWPSLQPHNALPRRMVHQAKRSRLRHHVGIQERSRCCSAIRHERFAGQVRIPHYPAGMVSSFGRTLSSNTPPPVSTFPQLP